MIPVKVCGITSLQDGLLAAHLGASAVGFVFYERSPRFVSPRTAKEISTNLPQKTSRVGVFVNPRLKTVHHVASYVGLDFVQLHGNESPEFCSQVRLPVIKAFRIRKSTLPEHSYHASVKCVLLDTYRPGQFGGTGSPFDWSMTKELRVSVPVILSGGLNASNILRGIEATQPDGVDINSGVEAKPGHKDQDKLTKMFATLKETGEYPNMFEIIRGQDS